MPFKLLPLALASALALGGAAYADTMSTPATPPVPATPPAAASVPAAVPAPAATTSTASGTISKIGAKGNFIVVDGTRYRLPKGFDATTLKVGEKVTVTYTVKGQAHIAKAVSAA